MVWKIRRNVARVIPIDRDGRVLLISGRDPVDRRAEPWWEIPGGGIDPGESPADAALRELAEEGGILEAHVTGVLWTQHVAFTFSGMPFEQFETIVVATVPDPDSMVPPRLELLERAAMGERRWWPVEDVLAGSFRIIPERLRDHLAVAASGALPEAPPYVDLR